MEFVRRLFTAPCRQSNTIDWTRKRYKGEGLFVVGMMRGRRMGNIWWKARWKCLHCLKLVGHTRIKLKWVKADSKRKFQHNSQEIGN